VALNWQLSADRSRNTTAEMQLQFSPQSHKEKKDLLNHRDTEI
jgi:hypothetical protein